MIIKRPTYCVLPMADGLALADNPNMRVEEKMDGEWHQREVNGSVIIGELMRDGRFYAFDLLFHAGRDLRLDPLYTRLWALESIHGLLRPKAAQNESCGEFLRSVLDNGGEGVVIKPLCGLWGDPWTKCKRMITERVIVAEINCAGKASVRIAAVTGEDRGWLPLRGEKFDRVRVGSVLKVEAYGYTEKGLLREARLDKDTETSWLVKY